VLACFCLTVYYIKRFCIKNTFIQS